MLLSHFTRGQPSRGEEITGLRLVNSINRDRNIFVIDREVVLATQYHKSLAHFDSPNEPSDISLCRTGLFAH